MCEENFPAEMTESIARPSASNILSVISPPILRRQKSRVHVYYGSVLQHGTSRRRMLSSIMHFYHSIAALCSHLGVYAPQIGLRPKPINRPSRGSLSTRKLATRNCVLEQASSYVCAQESFGSTAFDSAGIRKHPVRRLGAPCYGRFMNP